MPKHSHSDVFPSYYDLSSYTYKKTVFLFYAIVYNFFNIREGMGLEKNGNVGHGGRVLRDAILRATYFLNWNLKCYLDNFPLRKITLPVRVWFGSRSSLFLGLGATKLLLHFEPVLFQGVQKFTLNLGWSKI